MEHHPDPEREAELDGQVAERQAGMRREWEAERPEVYRRHAGFALALRGLSPERTRRCLGWVRTRPKRADEGGGSCG